MKIEKLSNNKKIIISVIIIIGIISIITIATSKAAYKSTQSIEIVKGTVIYSVTDLEIVELKVDGEDGSIPEKGYSLKSDSYCTEKTNGIDTKNTNITLTYSNGKLNIKNYNKKGTKCHLFFEEIKIPADQTLAKLKDMNVDQTDFDKNGVKGIDDKDHPGTLFQAKDNDGISYFYRGQASDNWVVFAGKRWRIIRINGDGTIRMIYQCGSTTCTDTTGSETIVAYSKNFNWGPPDYEAYMYEDNTFVGFYYGKTAADNYNDTHNNSNPSTMATYLKTWYEGSTGIPSASRKYIDTNAGFCNDRQPMGGVESGWGKLGYGENDTTYASYGRVYQNGKIRTTAYPTFLCGVNIDDASKVGTTTPTVNQANYERDYFTMKGATKGNKVLEVPVGLITADEATLAGGFYNTANEKYYLSVDNIYWTMTPFDNNYMFVIMESDTWQGGNGATGWWSYDDTSDVRPVINLRADVTFKSGDGTVNNPYVVNESV